MYVPFLCLSLLCVSVGVCLCVCLSAYLSPVYFSVSFVCVRLFVSLSCVDVFVVSVCRLCVCFCCV